MATPKKTRRTTARPARKTAPANPWESTRRALRSAEVSLGRKVKGFAARTGVPSAQVMHQADVWRSRLEREGARASKRVAVRLAELQQRARRDARSWSQSVDHAVARALAALNIPSRQEVALLSRRVEELSARVERLGRKRHAVA